MRRQTSVMTGLVDQVLMAWVMLVKRTGGGGGMLSTVKGWLVVHWLQSRPSHRRARMRVEVEYPRLFPEGEVSHEVASELVKGEEVLVVVMLSTWGVDAKWEEGAPAAAVAARIQALAHVVPLVVQLRSRLQSSPSAS